MTVPNADRAIIAPEKITGYLLNVSHKRGGPKARSYIAPKTPSLLGALSGAVYGLTVGVVLIVAAQIAGQAQRESGQGAVSSGVIGWWMTHPEDAGTSALDLLILWRGTPGWLFRSGGMGGNASGRQGFGSNTGTQTIWAGDRALTWTFDLTANTITILDQSFSLADVNVVLVDGADSPQGSRVVRAVRIDPGYPGDGLHFELALRRSPELLEFLQCDAQLGDPREQTLTALICARFTGR
jgi:hypothetical protein